MKKNEKKKEEQKKLYDFTCCREEISIGVFVDSDLSKTVANYIYQHTGDLASAEFARELFHKGKVEMDAPTRDLMRRNIMESQLLISVKNAVLELLKD